MSGTAITAIGRDIFFPCQDLDYCFMGKILK